MTGTEPRTVIRLEGLKKVFFTDEVETHALSDIQLEIREGEYLAVAGPSGCGKSTLLSILGLLDTPTEGEYALDGVGHRFFKENRPIFRKGGVGIALEGLTSPQIGSEKLKGFTRSPWMMSLTLQSEFSQ